MRKEMWREKVKKYYRGALISMLLVGIYSIFFLQYREYLQRIPDSICIRKGSSEELDYHVPASGQIIGKKSVPVSLSQKVTLAAGEMMNTYTMELKLYGVIPFKNVAIEVVPEQKVTPVGLPIGIYVKTQGVLVIDVGSFDTIDGVTKSPSKYILQKGDYLLEMDGTSITDKKQVMSYIAESQGNNIMFTIKRDEEIFDVNIKPEKFTNGEYKIGVWLRDSAQGIGTMTYVDEQNQFGALGHGINDIDTATLMQLDKGLLYQTDIIAIRKGERGKPGELTGFIEYTPEYIVGVIMQNSGKGIYGVASEKLLEEVALEPMEIGLKQDVKRGAAQIYCTIEGTPSLYDIEITDITYDSNNINRQISLEVTDEKLLAITGGIVQGMSGAPIIQDNKLIGAVTHVLINDSTKGYGIFIENMLEE